MKSVKILDCKLLIFLILSAIISCTEKANVQNPQTGEIAINPDFSSVPGQLAGQILDEYFGIKNALIEDNDSRARESAENLAKLVASNPELKIFQEQLDHILETGEVRHQRQHFQKLSDLVYLLISEVGGHTVVVYKQYCGMAFGNTGAFWLSASEEVINPYFGTKMLNCGSVQEKLEIKL